MTADKLGKALGIVHLDVGGADLDLKLQVGDGRNLRRIVLNDSYRKDKALMFEKFEEFMARVILRDYPHLKEDEVKGFVEFNCAPLHEKMLVATGVVSEEDYEKAKKDTQAEIKKLTGEL